MTALLNIFPSFEQFSRWSTRYSLIPFFCSFPAKELDYYSSFLSLSAKFKRTFFLDSSVETPKARYSFFPLSPPQKRFLATHEKDFPKVWESMQNYFNSYCAPKLPNRVPPFYGGAVGILSYDAGRFFEKGWRGVPPHDSLKFPLLDFGIYYKLACFDHKTDRFYLFSCYPVKKWDDSERKRIYQNEKKRVLRWVEQFKKIDPLVKSLQKDSEPDPKIADILPSSPPPFPPLPPLPLKKKFIESVYKIKSYISAGDIYQANFSQRIEYDFKGNPLNFFSRLRQINPSPYSCFFRLSRHEVVSCSPELLLKKRGRILETRPIAGTRPRGTHPLSDKQLSTELLLNQKERAEHIMLLDLERNDLGKVCESGSVEVTEKMGIEKYSHVMHIVSQVKGQLKERENIFSAIASVFPGGTITGCPKVRCMEILDETEPLARGPFFGSAGWIGFQGDGELNLLIRTAVIKPSNRKKSRVYIQVGSGIVADSDPELEYQESLHKASALIQALKE